MGLSSTYVSPPLESRWHQANNPTQLVLNVANFESRRSILSKKINFSELHVCSKHLIHIAEAVDSCLAVIDATLSNIPATPDDDDDNTTTTTTTTTTSRSQIHAQLRECLAYRRTLFKSSKLRLGSLQRRIDNAINLSFNLVTQQDSMLMIQDSTSMKIIAVITMIFLPTTGVATVLGSQLFTSEPPPHGATEVPGPGSPWVIMVNPLFLTMWWIAVPLTLGVAAIALVYQWYAHHERPTRAIVEVLVRAVTFPVARGKGATVAPTRTGLASTSPAGRSTTTCVAGLAEEGVKVEQRY